jgi:aspartyl/asparaginyl beta-hydroxylase
LFHGFRRPAAVDANRRRRALRAGNETRQWEAGKTLVFCDATGHEAWNLGATERVVLLVDLRNPGFRWRWLNAELTPEIERYICDQWDDMTIGEKTDYRLWRIANVHRRRQRRTRGARR